MFTVSVVAPINEGSEPVLTPDQVWSGLEHHVRASDLRFVPPGHDFKVIESDAYGVIRRAILSGGGQSREALQRVTFHNKRVMVMSTLEPFTLRIVSLEVNDEGNYCLRLTISAEKAGAPHAGPEEREAAGRQRCAALAAARRWIDVTRQLVKDGEL